MNLYELSTRFQQLMDQDELTAEDCAELDSLYDNTEDACIEKAKYIRNIEAEAEAINKVMFEMGQRELSLLNKATAQREKLVAEMKKCNINKITKSPLFAITIPKARSSVSITDDKLLPPSYWKTSEPKVTVTVDKVAIKAALEAGEHVPGATLEFKSKVNFK